VEKKTLTTQARQAFAVIAVTDLRAPAMPSYGCNCCQLALRLRLAWEFNYVAQGSWRHRHAAVHDLSGCRAPGLEQKHYLRACHGIGFHRHSGIYRDMGIPHRVRSAAVKTPLAVHIFQHVLAAFLLRDVGEEMSALLSVQAFLSSQQQ
jgi:hypothetical protein